MAKLTARTAVVAALFLLALPNNADVVNAFVTPPSTRRNVVDFTSKTLLHVTAEESAKALSDYMAKAHEEKLRAVKDAEQRKNAEIETLKKELAEAKSAGGSAIVQQQASAPVLATPPAPAEGSVEELQAKLASYQKFLADYIVNAQQQKLLAVQAAEKASEAKFAEKLKLLGGTAPPPPAAAALAGQSTEAKSFAERNAHVAAAAKAGKSRWGSLEALRASGNTTPTIPSIATTAPATPAADPTPPDMSAPVPPEVVEADHGLRADGGVGGLTLAQRVAAGALADPAAAGSAAPRETVLYNLRSAHVAAAGAAGKSRWGDFEVKRATESLESNGSIVVTPEIEAADHGLSANGAVGGPSLAERVNLGAQMLQNA
eukprot:CAMPEP_0185723296 /NCGR_PEP_ID=MMETSP1171-20130828/184_1 /TAXON_ID=374046 /ORGANISM="Helicotheca tamensis, Strain CCMP826" /LENGTH=374 /DNA_ID=CAMNT_0028390977 /DNA_START=26 /DNA_END=1150 /DNA_ORIENTATION=+